ncbi:hypothetical protein [Pseudomonas ogarae]|uniref:hypothetical protein n=1 Tax=Pseudomonas ogarae (strain DSM 112162 / CECT 30235 / F113) TaxID=1114970 RepID=UPI0002DA7437|nr:hypothetical protein [Pseudomonas ogarae]
MEVTERTKRQPACRHTFAASACVEERVANEAWEANTVGSGAIQLREVSGGGDEALSALLEQIRAELTRRGETSALPIQGVAPSHYRK